MVSDTGDRNISVQDGVLNAVGRDQHNYNVTNLNFNILPEPEDATHKPSSRSVNDAPVDLLSVHFTGRGNELDFIRETFSKTENGMPCRCAIYGMPGIGKTQLILQYSTVSFNQGQYLYVFWISATSVDKLNQGLVKILDLVDHRDRHLQEHSAKLTAARLWLEEPCLYVAGDPRASGADWLLVFDNVSRETCRFLRSHLPRKNTRGNILFTTRTAEVAEVLVNAAGVQYPTVHLRALDLRESTNLLFKDAGIDAEVATPVLFSQAEDLVKSVGCLPLAVAQAASFMRQTHTTLDEILELYNDERKIEVIRWENDLTAYQERSVAATLSIQLDQLDQEPPGTSHLLKILSFFDPENIPLKIITEGAKRDQLCPCHIFPEFSSLVTLIVSQIQFQKALQSLRNLSLVELRSHTEAPALQMHDLVRFLIQENARKEENYHEWLRSSVTLLCGAFERIEDPESPRWWDECETFIPHLQSLNQVWENAHGVSLELAEVNAGIAMYLGSRARYEEAETLYHRAFEVRDKELGPEHPKTLMIVNNLASVYVSQGRCGEAERLFKEALDSMEKNFGKNHQDSLVVMNNLASVYESQERYIEAEVIFNKVLVGQARQLGVDHRDTLMTMNNLAGIYERQRKYRAAESHSWHAVVGLTKQLGANHPFTLTAMNNLAIVYQSQGRHDTAEELYRRTLDGRGRQLGDDHQDTLTSVNNLAGISQSRGRYGEAEVLYKRALAGLEKLLGADHPFTLTTLNNLAIVYELQERHDEAEELYRHTLERREKQLGDDHPDTLTSVNNLAGVSQSRGRYDEAAALYERALTGRKLRLGINDQDTLRTTNNLAVVYEGQGRYNKAEVLSTQALAGFRDQLGADHPDTLMTMSTLAGVYGQQRRYDEAEMLYNLALAGKEKQLGADHPHTLVTVNDIAAICNLQGKYDEAKRLYERALEGTEKQRGTDHPHTLTMVNNLACIYQSQGQHGKAEAFFKRAVAGREKHLGEDHLDTLAIVNRLAGVYDYQGRHDEAEALYKRVLVGRREQLGGDHPHTLKTTECLAELYRSQGRYEEADAL